MGLISRVSSRTYRKLWLFEEACLMAEAHPLAALGDLNKFKVAELKDFLKQEGLPVSGKKAELDARLQEHIDSHRQPTPEVPSAAGDDNEKEEKSTPEEEGEKISEEQENVDEEEAKNDEVEQDKTEEKEEEPDATQEMEVDSVEEEN